MEINVLAA